LGDEDIVEYALILEDGTVLKSSRDFCGKGSATYPLRSEIYEEEFKNGYGMDSS
jgi:hypothetical protein